MSNRMLPIRAIIGPHANAPNAPPMQNTELIQALSSSVIGPVMRGLSSLNRTGSVGEHQPRAMPYAAIDKFTDIFWNDKNQIKNSQKPIDPFGYGWFNYRKAWRNIDYEYSYSFQYLSCLLSLQDDHQSSTVTQNKTRKTTLCNRRRLKTVPLIANNRHEQNVTRQYAFSSAIRQPYRRNIRDKYDYLAVR